MHEANKKGAKVTIEVIGTKGSTYEINHSTAHYPSTPDLSAFQGVPRQDIQVNNSGQSIVRNIDEAIKEATPVRQNEFWYPSLIPGLVLTVAGIIKNRRQWNNKLI